MFRCASILFVLYVGVVLKTSAEICGTCGATSSVQCLNSTYFALCDSGQPTSYYGSCPNGMYCVDDVSICSSDSSKACTLDCGKCVEQRFACQSNTTFMLCFGQDYPMGIEHKCPSGKICSTAKYKNSDGIDFCYDPNSLKPHEIDCSSQMEPIVPTPPLAEAPYRSFCKATGLFIDESDYSCKKYYNCFIENGKIFGALQQCGENKIFDSFKSECVSNLFYSCRLPSSSLRSFKNSKLYKFLK